MKRRDILQYGALGGYLALTGPGTALAEALQQQPAFPKGFLWGSATAAYQVEGAAAEDGRTPSIWDTFSHTPGKVRNGDTGDVADDSYHKYATDIALAKELGLKSFRFSFSWSRVQPNGKGPANPKGLDFYKRMVDGLLEAGIRPLPTLYHWDLPQALEDDGGWPNRDIADRFTDYTRILGESFADRIESWGILNEVKTFTQAGYLDGGHAPGRRDPLAFLKSTHTANIAVGNAFRTLKAINPKLQIGGAYDCANCWPATDSQADHDAAKRWDTMINLWYLQTTLTGQYPALLPADRQAELLGWQPGDEKLIKVPLDFVGINYYSGWKVSQKPGGFGVPGLDVAATWGWSPQATGLADNGWSIDPKGFYDILKRMQKVTGSLPIEITENGTADNTPPDAHGRIHDVKRLKYLRAHFIELRRAIADGVPVRAYHLWSLLDNFEWADGYSNRFGIVWVDFPNDQRRTIKDSGEWYARVIRENRVV